MLPLRGSPMPFLIIDRFGGPLGDPGLATFLGRPYEVRAGTVFELPADGLRVGRNPANDLVLHMRHVSSFHLRLTREGDHYVYEDVGSRQTPFYNGEPAVSRAGRFRRAVADGDTFNAAWVWFRYSESAPEGPAEPRAAPDPAT